MSAAQRRWAAWGIAGAIQSIRATADTPWWATTRFHPGLDPFGERYSPILLLLDEPEAGLHRSAENFMASGLSNFVFQHGRYVIGVSHSPALLDLDKTALYQVRPADQNGGAESGAARTHTDLEALNELGLNPSALLESQRAISAGRR